MLSLGGGQMVIPTLPPRDQQLAVEGLVARFEGGRRPRLLAQVQAPGSPGDTLWARWSVRDSAGRELAKDARRARGLGLRPDGAPRRRVLGRPAAGRLRGRGLGARCAPAARPVPGHGDARAAAAGAHAQRHRADLRRSVAHGGQRRRAARGQHRRDGHRAAAALGLLRDLPAGRGPRRPGALRVRVRGAARAQGADRAGQAVRDARGAAHQRHLARGRAGGRPAAAVRERADPVARARAATGSRSA